MNMDVYSLIMVWGLDVGEPVEVVKKMMETIVHSDYLNDMDLILEWAILGVGIDVRECFAEASHERFRKPLSFIQWPTNCGREHCWAEAKQGWKALKIFMQITELDEVIRQAKVEVEGGEGRVLRPHKNKRLIELIGNENEGSSQDA